jgi:hypothetical protein
MLGLGAGGAGAIIGMFIGLGLSVYVGLLDARKRAEGSRVRVQYVGSLVVVPALFAGIGALVGVGLAAIL